MDSGELALSGHLTLSAQRLADDWLCLRLQGELDLDGAQQLKRRLLADVAAHRGVLLDLAGVEFVDSTGIAVLMAALRYAQAVGGSLEFARPLPSQPQRLLEITGLLSELVFRDAAPPTAA